MLLDNYFPVSLLKPKLSLDIPLLSMPNLISAISRPSKLSDVIIEGLDDHMENQRRVHFPPDDQLVSLWIISKDESPMGAPIPAFDDNNLDRTDELILVLLLAFIAIMIVIFYCLILLALFQLIK